MASINGITVKNLKSFKGHEGETLYQGTIYKGKDKLGFWSNDYYCGEDSFDFDLKLIEDEVLQARSIFDSSSWLANAYDAGLFINDIVNLKILEKEFKKVKKEGFKGLLVSYVLGLGCGCYKPFSALTEITEENMKDLIQESLKSIEGEYSSYERHHAVEFEKNLDIQVGKKEDVATMKEILDNKKKADKETAEKQEEEREEMRKKIKNNGRFVYEENPDYGYTIYDTQTDNSTVVPVYAFTNVMKALVELFC